MKLDEKLMFISFSCLPVCLFRRTGRRDGQTGIYINRQTDADKLLDRWIDSQELELRSKPAHSLCHCEQPI